MVRMLHIVGSMSPSGIGNFIMNIYRNIDRSLVQFDFIVHEHREVSFDDEIRAMGGRLFYVTRKAVSPFRNFIEIEQVVKKGSYDFVFRHTDTATVAVDLVAATLGGAKHRIAHSHSTSTPNVRMHKLFQPLLNMICTERFACSKMAGEWLYGKNRTFRVIWNAINLDLFAYNKEKREEVRKKEQLQDKLVIGHVGNFLPVKNHLFMLEVFAELVKEEPNALLLFVGDGELRPQIEEKIKHLAIEDNVRLAGVRNDIADLLQAMDVFFFPSKYEGLPIAMVEAQAAGLPCLVTDVITTDVEVTDLVCRMSLDENPTKWAEIARELAKTNRKTPDFARFIANGFDIREMVKDYETMTE